MKRSRFAALFLILAMALSLTPASAAEPEWLVPKTREYTGQFTDVTGTWCETAVQTVYEAGLMEGKSADRFDPKASLTNAQITVITARLQELLNGEDGVLPAPAEGEAWYIPAFTYLKDQLPTSQDATSAQTHLLIWINIVHHSGDASIAAAVCSRSDFVTFLTAILPERALTSINRITLLPDTNETDVLRFYNAGILTGSNEYGTFNGSDSLTRGQAAAMLARIIDPSQRVTFTPKPLVASEALLGLAPDTVMLTIDSFDVTAELYTYLLTEAIYSRVFLNQQGKDTPSAVDWDALDADGTTPAQKIREEILRNATYTALLLHHQSDYPLSAQQREALQTGLRRKSGYTVSLTEQLDSTQYLLDNLVAKQEVTVPLLKEMLRKDGCVYGLCAYFDRTAEGFNHQTDAEAKAAAETFYCKIMEHPNDSDYLEYLLNEYPDYSGKLAVNLSDLGPAEQATLKNLANGKISPVLTTDFCYFVLLKQEPSLDDPIAQTVASGLAMSQLDAWAAEAQVTISPACDAVNVAQAAAVCDALGI